MLRKYLIPALALAGVAFALVTVIRGQKTPPPVPPSSPSPQSPYAVFVAGSGIVESSSENIAVGTPTAGIVADIFVRLGSAVKTGDPLFALDDRAQRAEIATRKAAVHVADAQLADATYESKLAEALAVQGILSIEERQRKRFVAEKAGAQVAQAHAELHAAEVELERLTVRAPVDGQVLQIKAHLGEFAPVAATPAAQSPLVLLGSVTPLNVRVDVDENDAWRVPAEATATGYLRGHRELASPLRFVRFEPFVLPKKSLTGDGTERVDTRVLQVIFSIERHDLPVFVGQQMDVFIAAKPPS